MIDEQTDQEDGPVSETSNEPEKVPKTTESKSITEIGGTVPETTNAVIESIPEMPENAAGETLAELAEVIPEAETVQMGGIEPLPETTDESAGATTEQEESATEQEAEAPEGPTPTQTKKEDVPQTQSVEREEKPTKKEPSIKEKLALLRQMAHATIALRREKKYVKIMELLAKQTAITNNDVQGLLRVSDATATRYLAELEKRGKLAQVGTTGRGVSYVKR